MDAKRALALVDADKVWQVQPERDNGSIEALFAL